MQCAWMIRHDRVGLSVIHGRKTPQGLAWRFVKVQKLGSGNQYRKDDRSFLGGAAGIRTPDLRLAKAALSQLSYGPLYPSQQTHPLVGAPGLEPGTSALSGPRSDHLSYAPVATPSGWSSSNTVWRPEISGYLCPRRSARSRPLPVSPAVRSLRSCRCE